MAACVFDSLIISIFEVSCFFLAYVVQVDYDIEASNNVYVSLCVLVIMVMYVFLDLFYDLFSKIQITISQRNKILFGQCSAAENC